MRTPSAKAGPILAIGRGFLFASSRETAILRRHMAVTGERDDPAFPVGAACRIDSRSPWREIAEIPVGLDPEGIAVDNLRRRAFIACSRSDFVSVVDLETHEVITEIATGSEPIDMGLDEETGRVFAAGADADQVTNIGWATLGVEPALRVGARPLGL